VKEITGRRRTCRRKFQFSAGASGVTKKGGSERREEKGRDGTVKIPPQEAPMGFIETGKKSTAGAVKGHSSRARVVLERGELEGARQKEG